MGLIDKVATKAASLAIEDGAAAAFLAEADRMAGSVMSTVGRRFDQRHAGVLREASSAYQAQDWVATKSTHEVLLQLFIQPVDGSLKGLVSTVGRIARADFHHGDFDKAERGFRQFLGIAKDHSALRSNVLTEMADILDATGRGARSGMLRARALGNTAELPDFSRFTTPLTAPLDYKMTDQAYRQFRQLNDNGFISEPLTRGYFDFNVTMKNLGEGELPKQPMLTLFIDQKADPALNLAVRTVERKLGHLRDKPAEFAAALGEYTDRLFSAQSHYADRWGELMTDWGIRPFLGEYLRLRLGTCVPQALFIKHVADEVGLRSTMYTGYVTREITRTAKGGHHRFSTIDIGSKERLYDSTMKRLGESFKSLRGRGYRRDLDLQTADWITK